MRSSAQRCLSILIVLALSLAWQSCQSKAPAYEGPESDQPDPAEDGERDRFDDAFRSPGEDDDGGRSQINIVTGNDDDDDWTDNSGDDDDDGDDNDNDQQDRDPETSGGSGGDRGLVEKDFTDSAGLRGRYKINWPENLDDSKTYGLHIHLHGDGGDGYRQFPNREPAHDLIGVTVEAPNRTRQWGRRSGPAHGVFVHDLIQNELLKQYDVQLDRIYFSGVSGGAYFLTGSFIPTHGHHYNSGAFILCGGEPPRVPFANPDTIKKFRVFWQSTEGERFDISRSVNASIAAYDRELTQALAGDRSFDKKSVQDSQIEGRGGHCEFYDQPYTPGIQQMIDRRFNVTLKPQD